MEPTTTDETMSAPDHDTEDHIVIDDLETFRIIDNPLRQRICHLTRHPRSVKEIAATLRVPVTRLYYHVNLLESAGFIEVAEVRKSGAQLERVYRGRRGTIVPSAQFVEQIGDPAEAARVLAGALLDNTRAEVEAVMEKNLRNEEVFGTVSRGVLQLPADVAAEFLVRIEDLADEMRAAARETESEDAEIYSFTYAFVPTDIT
jgi:hypothetical protein